MLRINCDKQCPWYLMYNLGALNLVKLSEQERLKEHFYVGYLFVLHQWMLSKGKLKLGFFPVLHWVYKKTYLPLFIKLNPEEIEILFLVYLNNWWANITWLFLLKNKANGRNFIRSILISLSSPECYKYK